MCIILQLRITFVKPANILNIKVNILETDYFFQCLEIILITDTTKGVALDFEQSNKHSISNVS